VVHYALYVNRTIRLAYIFLADVELQLIDADNISELLF